MDAGTVTRPAQNAAASASTTTGITTSSAARSRPARPTRNAETAIVGVLPEDKLSRSNAKSRADWSPDGAEMAGVRLTDGPTRLEYPLGKMLYETNGWISDTRVSPDGDKVAFIDHPIIFDSRGRIMVVDRAGQRKTLATGFGDVLGLSWHPSGEEIWFTGSREHLSSNLLAVNLSGKQRLVWAGEVILQDIARDGRALMIRQNRRRGIAGLAPGQKAETDLSWQDWSLPMAISPDGKWIFFAEEGDAGGPRYSAYMRNTNGSPAIRLGDGVPQSVSPDGKWVAAIVPGEPQQLMLLPTRAGDVRNVSRPEFNYEVADWLPDGKRLLVSGNEPGKPSRSYLQGADGGPLTPVAGRLRTVSLSSFGGMTL